MLVFGLSRRLWGVKKRKRKRKILDGGRKGCHCILHRRKKGEEGGKSEGGEVVLLCFDIDLLCIVVLLLCELLGEKVFGIRCRLLVGTVFERERRRGMSIYGSDELRERELTLSLSKSSSSSVSSSLAATTLSTHDFSPLRADVANFRMGDFFFEGMIE